MSSCGVLDCLYAEGVRAKAELLPDSTVFTHLIVLRIRIGEAGGAQQKVSLALLADSMSVEQFRQLRLCLRWPQAVVAKANPNGSTGKDVA